jgi:hypothetical protein
MFVDEMAVAIVCTRFAREPNSSLFALRLQKTNNMGLFLLLVTVLLLPTGT